MSGYIFVCKCCVFHQPQIIYDEDEDDDPLDDILCFLCNGKKSFTEVWCLGVRCDNSCSEIGDGAESEEDSDDSGDIGRLVIVRSD